MSLQLALAALVMALVLFFISGRKRRAAGLPGGRVIYTDTGGWEQPEKPLYDPVTEISGRPDYLVKQGKLVITVEVKSGRTPEKCARARTSVSSKGTFSPTASSKPLPGKYFRSYPKIRKWAISLGRHSPGKEA